MAFLSEEERRAIIDQTKLRPLTDRTIVRPGELEQELRRIRERGYACSTGQRIPGAVGLAAPIFGPAGRVIGDLWLTIPESRFQPRTEADLARLVIDYARRVSEPLGQQPVPAGRAPAGSKARRRGGQDMDGRRGR
jgi:DNA-binding IclR family transcriptional regulator